MENSDRAQNRRVTRRTFVKGGLAVGGLLAGGAAVRAATEDSGDAATTRTPAPTRRLATAPPQGRPNILVILVDQLRYPQWLSAAPLSSAGMPPNLQRLSSESVVFGRHYTASNDCTPSRATLLTGLYTHQTGCMITGGSTLDAGFPTWGTMLREHGYNARWYGKWHLTHGDNKWRRPTGEHALERYGFAGGTFPSPDGAPGQGWRVDPHVARQFAQWFAQEGAAGPWCTTVSFVNPHDIAWWYVWTDRVAAEAADHPAARRLPPNYETPEQLIERRKPRLQRALQATAATSFGPVPFHGPAFERLWLEFMGLYAKLQMDVDRNVGNVLATLASQPDVAANTVVVFSSDHGEYGASHGLRGKGGGVYEEAIRVPLMVRDPRGLLAAAPERVRAQLTSSVDVAPLLLTIATGSADWRREAHYAHIAGRADMAAILSDPAAPGRRQVLHATDEIVTEFAVEPYAHSAPLHVVAMRTAKSKYATYSHWTPGSTALEEAEQESELYEYADHDGRLELTNSAGSSAAEERLRAELERAVAHELRAPLPAHLRAAQKRGFADYFSTAKRAAKGAAAARKRRTERVVGGSLHPGDTGEGRTN